MHFPILQNKTFNLFLFLFTQQQVGENKGKMKSRSSPLSYYKSSHLCLDLS